MLSRLRRRKGGAGFAQRHGGRSKEGEERKGRQERQANSVTAWKYIVISVLFALFLMF